MRVIFYFITVFSFIFFGSCSSFKAPKLVSVNNVKLLSDTKDQITLETDLTVLNPNWFDISSSDVAFKIYVGDKYVGTADISDGFNLIKDDTSSIISTLIIEKSFLDSNFNIKDSVVVNVMGSSKVPYMQKYFYFEFDYKINLEDYFISLTNEIVKELDLKIKKVEVKNIDLMKINLEVYFNLNNLTKNEYEVTKLDINIYNSPSYSKIIGRTSIDDSFVIKADTLNVFKSNVNINTLSMGTALLSNTISKMNSFYIEVNSTINYKKLEIPVSIKKKLDYNPLTFEIMLNE